MGVIHCFEVAASLENIRVNGRLDVWLCGSLATASHREVAASDSETAKYNDIMILHTIAENRRICSQHPFSVHS
jgi:hypothetical protein